MSIKILLHTLYDYENYGTVLQAYSLKKYLDNQGYAVDILKYSDKSIKSYVYDFFLKVHHFIFSFDKNKKYYYRRINSSNLKIRSKEFKEFKDRYLNSCCVLRNKHNIKELSDKYDLYLIGSDQTWNPNLTTFNTVFLLDYVKKGLKAAYAPSIGVSSMNDKQKDMFRHYLKSFSHISCREKTGAALLNNIMNIDIPVVLDPTFLIDIENWEKLIREIDLGKDESEPYVLQYFLGDSENRREKVESIAKQINCKVVSVGIHDIDLKKNNNIFVGPEKFLRYIKNAKLIITDSFHGTVFSILFNKPFYTFLKENSNKEVIEPSRMIDLLSCLGLEKRLLSTLTNEDICCWNDIDYSIVNSIIKKRKEESICYINNILMDIKLKR